MIATKVIVLEKNDCKSDVVDTSGYNNKLVRKVMTFIISFTGR